MSDALTPHLPKHAVDSIGQFLRHHTTGTDGGLVGMSGGIDSALVARLARDALGPERILGVLLPDSGPSKGYVEETAAFARELGIPTMVLEVDPIVSSARSLLPELVDPTAIGNLAARARMLLLYALARNRRRLVLGTGNKSELLLGYFTKYGDGGVDLLPIGDLYKTEVRELAGQLGLPEGIRRRIPSAGFWEGQSDEAELGLPYSDLDRVLYGFEHLRTEAEIARLTGIPQAAVEAIGRRMQANRHKRRLPPIPKLGHRTIGLDWRD